MIPKIISSIPQHGSEDVPLDIPIKIKFSTNIAWALLREGNFVVRNVTKNEEVPLDEDIPFEVDTEGMSLTIYPKKIGDDYFLGGTVYTVNIINIRDSNLFVVPESYMITFKTKGLDPIIEYEPGEEPEEPDFRILFTYPRYNAANIDPKNIRVRFTEAIDKDLLVYDQEDPACVLTVTPLEPNPETGDFDFISGEFDPIDAARPTDIVFVPDNLRPNTIYLVETKQVSSLGGQTFGNYSFSFRTKGAHTHTTIKEIYTMAPFLEVFLAQYNDEDIYGRIDLVGRTFEEYCKLHGIDYDPDDPPFYFVEYIKCYFVYDTILNRITEMGASAQSKRLGDLQISYSNSISDLLKLLDLWLRRANRALEALQGGMVGSKTPAAFIRGVNIDEVYEFMSRGLQIEEETTKEW